MNEKKTAHIFLKELLRLVRYLNGGYVGVDDDSVDTLLLERLDGLGAGVVELPRLPDGQAARTQDQHLRTKNISGRIQKFENTKTTFSVCSTLSQVFN